MSRTAARPGLEQAWRHIYDRTYHLDPDPAALGLDTSGWINTYTGEPYTRAEMAEWVDETVARIREHRPRRVLEIGCGTGMLGHRLIPEVEAYCGLDFSVGALQRFSRGMDPATRAMVCLLLGSAKDLDRVPRWDYDCVILNSVLQYFPDTRYVKNVLRQAAALVKPPGVLFLGDVRHRELLPVHHAWRAWRSEADDATAGAARDGAARRHRSDREWSADPVELAGLLRSVGARHVETRPKDGTLPTEMNLCRYDAVGHVRPAVAAVEPAEWIVWEPGAERRIDFAARRPVGFLGVPHTRLTPMLTAERALRDAPHDTPLGRLRAAVPDDGSSDEPLAALRASATEHGAVIRTDWARDRTGHTLDLAVLFEPDTPGQGDLLVGWPTAGQGEPA